MAPDRDETTSDQVDEDDNEDDLHETFNETVSRTLISDDPGSTCVLSQSQLFAVVENAITVQPIVEFFYNDASAKQRRDEARAVVAKLNRVKSRRLFASLLPLMQRVVEEASYQHHEQEGEADEAEINRSLQFLRICADLLVSHLDSLKKNKPSVIDEAFEMTTMLHDLLFPLHQSPSKHAAATSSSIFSLCEKWWHLNLEDREQLVTQLIPLLLLSSLDEHATKSDVKRLFSMREALDLLDFGDPSIESLEKQLLRTISHPLFLQCTEGKRFLSHLFTVDAGFISRLHSAVRVQIPHAKKSILNAYADVYWHAWKSSAGDDREEILLSLEENAIQDLTFQVIHAANPTTSKNCRSLLDRFLLYKKEPAVESMLYRTYGPLLWRSLIASNARVRLQAATVLADTFPLRDLKSNVGYDAVVTKTVESVVKLMRDEVPNVRVAGCVCAGKILGGFWVAVPSKDIRILLNEIIAKHASDTTSSAVRNTAIQTITALLYEEKTHAVLRPLLPSLGNMIHDKTEKVRLSVVKMLLVVKKLKGMKYYHVVPAKHLLARLAEEGRGKNNPTGPVAKSLTELLSNSFFPTGSKTTTADVIGRTFRLLQDNPNAALTFYKNASTQLSVHSVVKLISALMKCLCFLIVEEKKNGKEDVSSLELSLVVEEEGFDCSCETKDEFGVERMATIAESISILWESIESDLKKTNNAHVHELLLDAFSGNIVTEIFCHFENKFDDSSNESIKWDACFRALVAILNCAGKMDGKKFEGLRAHIFAELDKSWDSPPEQRSKANFTPYVSLLCAWGMAEELAECLALSITNYFAGGGDKQPPRKKTRGSNIHSSLPLLHIDVCLSILGHTLQGAYPALVVARDCILKCEAGLNAIVAALRKAEEVAVVSLRAIGPPTLEVDDELVKNIGKCIECHGRIILHNIGNDFPVTLPAEALDLINWVSESIVPALIKLIGQNNTLRDLDISGISGVDSPMNSPISTHAPRRRSSRYSSFQHMSLRLSDATLPECGSYNVYQEHSKFTCTIAAAVSCIRSVVLIFAEWLSICRVCDTSIMSYPVKWCEVLKSSDENVRKALLPIFSRVALLCLTISGNSAMLDEILAYVQDADLPRAEQRILSSFSCGLVSLQGQEKCEVAIASIVRAICSSFQQFELNGDEPTIPSSILARMTPGIKAILLSLLSDNRGSLILAQHLQDDTIANPLKAKLLEEVATHAPKSAALNKILRQWAMDQTIMDSSAIFVPHGVNDEDPS
ncbi:hypothetical protein HJC23_008376 [Cyclotella cryptica]|uniref:Condensin-2 complex subunit G2 n=1 Tax=Cyclotella cryptica TaxID=29204 RepID=A0ABD3PJV7_9STRA|eukprot:CCRYP_014022-RA/>CCRYP_014022-RA protein AED:0.10 eAED:0.10 QI:209/1/1/1/0.75/0.6/5/1840/1250